MGSVEDGHLFSKSLIKPEDEKELIARPLHIADYDKGYCQILNQLTEVEDVDKKKFESRFYEWQSAKDVYYIVVIEDIKKKRIIGAASLVVEKKMIHGAAKCGHIEDVVVDESYRGKQLGKRVIDQLVYIGKMIGCYKIILDCAEKNVPFYQKCGFQKKEVQMVAYLNKSKL